jgi:enolase-phosphatase E1
MIRLCCRAVLLDVEGTTSDLAFVHDVLFPYARREVGAFLDARHADPAVVETLERMAADAGHAGFRQWCPHPPGTVAARDHVVAEVHRLMDADAKTTGLKALQGLVWERGYRDGVLRAHVFEDVPRRLAAWTRAGLAVGIYSSGSVAAQRLFFAHSVAGDLTGFLSGHHDTTVGPKREPASYRAIAADMALPPELIVFLSDVPAELDAAVAAGMAAVLMRRPGNKPVGEVAHPSADSFDAVELEPGGGGAAPG